MLYVCESVHSYPQTYIHRLSSVSNSCRLTQKQIEASEVTTEADFFTGNTICGRPYLERKNACYRHLQRLWPIHSHTQSNPSSQRVRVVAIQKSYYSHVLVKPSVLFHPPQNELLYVPGVPQKSCTLYIYLVQTLYNVQLPLTILRSVGAQQSGLKLPLSRLLFFLLFFWMDEQIVNEVKAVGWLVGYLRFLKIWSEGAPHFLFACAASACLTWPAFHWLSLTGLSKLCVLIAPRTTS